MAIQRILFICIGNICRSPMAEALLKTKLIEYCNPKTTACHHPAFEVTSAGLSALVNHPAAPEAETLLKKRDIDISAHRARQLDVNIVKDSDIIFTMDQSQRQFILKRYPFACGKTFLLGDEVKDPYRGTEADFQDALQVIEKGIERWLPKLCS